MSSSTSFELKEGEWTEFHPNLSSISMLSAYPCDGPLCTICINISGSRIFAGDNIGCTVRIKVEIYKKLI